MSEGKASAFASVITDFAPVPRVLLILGFIVGLFGLPAGIKTDNRTLIVCAALITGGFAGHYWPETRYGPIYTNDAHSAGLRWGNLLLAFIYRVLFVGSAYFACKGK